MPLTLYHIAVSFEMSQSLKLTCYRRKLAKSHIFVSENTAQILHVEEFICESHWQGKLHDEEIAVTKIKMDPNYFFRYAKKT